MATPSRLTQSSRSSSSANLNIHSGLREDQLRLPTGACNFTNLSGGGTRCGCRRFWDRALGESDSHNGNGLSKPGWCMCEHHACFHDFAPVGGLDGSVIEAGSLSSSNRAILAVEAAGAAAAELDNQDNSIPDTYNWRNLAKHGSSLGSLPPIPSQCLLPSDSGSDGTASQTRYTRPFAGVGLHTLSHIPRPTGPSAPAIDVEAASQHEQALQTYEESVGHGYLQSLTDVATPVRSGTPVKLHQTASSHTIQESVTLGSQEPPNEGRLLARLDKLISHVSSYPNQIQNHERRLDLLENASFSNAGLEDLQDKIDQMDAHIVELENKIEEMEKAQVIAMNDHNSISSKVDGSFSSGITVTSSAMILSAVDRVDVSSRIEALEAEIRDLQAAAQPSYTRPWEVEVVFLPYGSYLPGIWSSDYSSRPPSRPSSGTPDGWTQSQYNSLAAAQARLVSLNESITWEDASTTGGDQGNPWLLPRACGRRSKIDERLRSRGLVKCIQIRGPDARDVQAAMLSEFGDVLSTINGQTDKYAAPAIPDSLSSYLGLQASWVPLRKVHKDSRLRFLEPSEMVTPALWTVPFLASSVAMRTSGIRRLYVTHRDSYIQHLSNVATEWTWQKLRELPRIYPNGESSMSHTPEADAQEPCWEYDERLDAPLSATSSFSSLHQSLNAAAIEDNAVHPASPSDHFSSRAASRSPSSTPSPTAALALRALPPIKERQPFGQIHKRTFSLPPLAIKTSPLMNKRRNASSFEHESQQTPGTIPSSGLKRRRLSRSPSRPDDTPRWSIGPPSPYFGDELEHKRGTTPFAYATPHSNAPYVEGSRPRSGAGESHLGDIEEDQGSTTDDFNLEDDSKNDDDQEHDYDYYGSDDDAAFVDDQGHQTSSNWEGMDVDSHNMSYASRKQEPIKVYEDEAESDGGSESSSQPSEYPITEEHRDSLALRERVIDKKRDPGFTIHVDEVDNID
ncbi:hypothetical protein F5884DRAFT_60816 [Xylogone sp. PMI_703]|nr:hypothetical protein F5884DRAFT_60816 [Xylogone sp. PMI_703]